VEILEIAVLLLFLQTDIRAGIPENGFGMSDVGKQLKQSSPLNQSYFPG
jgi:hypothetical protein